MSVDAIIRKAYLNESQLPRQSMVQSTKSESNNHSLIRTIKTTKAIFMMSYLILMFFNFVSNCTVFISTTVIMVFVFVRRLLFI